MNALNWRGKILVVLHIIYLHFYSLDFIISKTLELNAVLLILIYLGEPTFNTVVSHTKEC